MGSNPSGITTSRYKTHDRVVIIKLSYNRNIIKNLNLLGNRNEEPPTILGNVVGVKPAFKKPIGVVAQLVGRRFEKIGWKSSNLFSTTYNVSSQLIINNTNDIVCFS